MGSSVDHGDQLFLVVFALANVLSQGPLAAMVRSRRGEKRADRVRDAVRVVLAFVFTLWVSFAWGFLWWGVTAGVGALLVAAGTWLYRRRVALRAGLGSVDRAGY